MTSQDDCATRFLGSDRPHMASLNILHVLRAPVGGLFRHVVDLARGQAERGHRVGLIADSSSGGAQAEAENGRPAPGASCSAHKSLFGQLSHGTVQPAIDYRPLKYISTGQRSGLRADI